MDTKTIKQNLNFIESILINDFDMEFYRCLATNKDKCNIIFSERDYEIMVEVLQETLEILDNE